MATGIEGKTVIITGGASGIGKATALAFARKGARVVVATGRSLAAAEQTVREMQTLGTEAIFVQCDVAEEAQVEAMVAEAVGRFGSVDFAFNNAGVGADGVSLPFLPLTELSLADWDAVSDTNLKGVFLCLKHELRQMRKQRSGVIVNTASTSAMHVHPYFGAYPASKAGMIALSKMAALENKDAGIRVNVVAPGPIRHTGLSDRLLSCVGATGAGATAHAAGARQPGGAAAGGTSIPVPPLALMGVPEDVARVVIWLCSDEASFINGNVLSVDGGLDIS